MRLLEGVSTEWIDQILPFSFVEFETDDKSEVTCMYSSSMESLSNGKYMCVTNCIRSFTLSNVQLPVIPLE